VGGGAVAGKGIETRRPTEAEVINVSRAGHEGRFRSVAHFDVFQAPVSIFRRHRLGGELDGKEQQEKCGSGGFHEGCPWSNHSLQGHPLTLISRFLKKDSLKLSELLLGCLEQFFCLGRTGLREGLQLCDARFQHGTRL
jgi:hypothetical protein